MSDPTPKTDGAIDPHAHSEFDREIKVGPLWLTVLGLAVLIAVSMVGMWWFSGGLRAASVARDPVPSPIPEARDARTPPGPRLQASPEGELIEMQSEYERQLTSYGWVDQSAGVARIPVERALELLAEEGRLPTALAATGAVSQEPASAANAAGPGIEQEDLGPEPSAGTTAATDPAADGGHDEVDE
jgi:hypothetical protein